MKTKILILALIGLAINIQTFPQIKDASQINQYNADGKKDGFWKEDLGYQFEETYYHNGLKNGIFKAYRNGKLSYFGEYKNGGMCGTWYYFDDFGGLVGIQKEFQKNDKLIPAVHRASGIAEEQCYTISFYPNGVKESEGILLWDESPESDMTFEYGEWKYYDEQGNLIKTKIFK